MFSSHSDEFKSPEITRIDEGSSSTTTSAASNNNNNNSIATTSVGGTATTSPTTSIIPTKDAGSKEKDRKQALLSAAKIVSASIEDSIKATTDDLHKCVTDTSTALVKCVSKEIAGFGEKFKETGIQGFEEWGLSIERALNAVGDSFEAGFDTGLGVLGKRIENSLNKASHNITSHMERAAAECARNLARTGTKQAPVWRRTFGREISAASVAVVLLCLSVFLYSATKFAEVIMVAVEVDGDANGSSGSIIGGFNLLFVLKILVCIFIAANSYVIHSWSCRNRFRESISAENIKVLVLIIGGVGFLMGNIASHYNSISNSSSSSSNNNNNMIGSSYDHHHRSSNSSIATFFFIIISEYLVPPPSFINAVVMMVLLCLVVPFTAHHVLRLQLLDRWSKFRALWRMYSEFKEEHHQKQRQQQQQHHHHQSNSATATATAARGSANIINNNNSNNYNYSYSEHDDD